MPPAFQHLDEIVQGLSTKSDKIRALGRRGISTSDIAKYLGIRYQHARNVLLDGGLASTRRQDVNVDSSASAESEIRLVDTRPVWIDVDEEGRMQLPLHLCEAVGIEKGTRVHVRVNEDAIEILSQRAAVKRAHDIVREFVPPGVSLVDELIEERRREVQKEEEES